MCFPNAFLNYSFYNSWIDGGLLLPYFANDAYASVQLAFREEVT